jgi:hypothetical protein
MDKVKSDENSNSEDNTNNIESTRLTNAEAQHLNAGILIILYRNKSRTY